jgi:hypothetical protein
MTSKSFAGYEVFAPRSYEYEMKKAMRQMRGFPCFQFTVNGGESEAEFLADFAGLTTQDDRRDEDKLSAALAKLLKVAMELRHAEKVV